MIKELIMVLDDGETFSGLDGCLIAELLVSDDSLTRPEKEWNELVKEPTDLHGANNLLIWEEYGVIAKVVLIPGDTRYAETSKANAKGNPWTPAADSTGMLQRIAWDDGYAAGKLAGKTIDKNSVLWIEPTLGKEKRNS